MRKGNFYQYLCKGKGQYINIEVGNDDIIYWTKELIELNKGDKLILKIIRKK